MHERLGRYVVARIAKGLGAVDGLPPRRLGAANSRISWGVYANCSVQSHCHRARAICQAAARGAGLSDWGWQGRVVERGTPSLDKAAAERRRAGDVLSPTRTGRNQQPRSEEEVALVRLATGLAVAAEADFLGIVGTEFVAEELAVGRTPWL